MELSLSTDDRTDAAIGELADAAERHGWYELAITLRAELIRRESERPRPMPLPET